MTDAEKINSQVRQNEKILNLNNNMEEIKYEDTEVYKIYKDFLNNPYGMQNILFEE